MNWLIEAAFYYRILVSGLVSVPDEFDEEMKGLAEASGGKLPYALVQRLNIGYDFVAKCTSSGPFVRVC